MVSLLHGVERDGAPTETTPSKPTHTEIQWILSRPQTGMIVDSSNLTATQTRSTGSTPADTTQVDMHLKLPRWCDGQVKSHVRRVQEAQQRIGAFGGDDRRFRRVG